jgi:phosphate transport system substrate-binding protein
MIPNSKIMKLFFLIGFAFVSFFSLQAQTSEVLAKADLKNTEDKNKETKIAVNQKVFIITGARFSYKLVQRWIDDFNKVNPKIQIIIESRGSTDPAKYDVLAEVYQQDEDVKKTREYINVGRYAILPVASASSEFSNIYGKKGLTTELIKQIYFHNIFADNDAEEVIRTPYTVFTRLQKAGVPIVFTKYFGFEQKDIKGKAIAGSDDHLLKALLRDSTGISYLPLPLIYDLSSRKLIEGLTVLPVDLDGNGKVNDEEKIYDNLNTVIQKFESSNPKDLKNVPIEYLHLSVDKSKASPEAVTFLKWVNENGHNYLNEFGYLKPEANKFEKEKFIEFASKRAN